MQTIVFTPPRQVKVQARLQSLLNDCRQAEYLLDTGFSVEWNAGTYQAMAESVATIAELLHLELEEPDFASMDEANSEEGR